MNSVNDFLATKMIIELLYCAIEVICKLSHVIFVADSHCDYQRIIWREDTYIHAWTCSALFLAGRVLDQLAHGHKHKFPTAANLFKEEFYVDDVLTEIAKTYEDGQGKGRALSEKILCIHWYPEDDTFPN